MITNYLKTGTRNLLKYKTFSFINIFGLATAISICLFLILMLADQKSYDQFNTRKDRIYRILSDQEGSKSPNAVTSYPLATTLKNDYPIIEETTSISRGIGGEVLFNNRLTEVNGYFADASFFKVFSFELSEGDPKTALSEPFSIVITKDYASRIFGKEDPLGKAIRYYNGGLANIKDEDEVSASDWGLFTIRGIIDSENYKSHLQFDLLVSSSSTPSLVNSNKLQDFTSNWTVFPSYTYALMNEGKSEVDLNLALTNLVSKHYVEEYPKDYVLFGQSLTSITPGIITGNESSPSIPMVGYYFFFFLAFVILFSACLNYVNLSIARALTRQHEIGIRKTSGANRKDIAFQFLIESVIAGIISLFIAAFLLFIIIPLFKQLWINQYINFDLQGNALVYGISILFTLLIGTLAGIFPALHLSGFKPVASLKKLENSRPGKLTARKILTTFQFIISLLFITTSILIYNQFSKYIHFNYGFTSDRIINIPLQGNDYNLVQQEFKSVSGVVNISASDLIPATNENNGINLKLNKDQAESTRFDIIHTDDQLIENLKLKLIAGENLPTSGSASDQLIVVNESGAKSMGFSNPPDIVGQSLYAGSDEILTVIGVVSDFRSRMLMNGKEIGAVVLRNIPERFKFLNLQLVKGREKETIAGLEESWATIDPMHPFKYEYYSDQLSGIYSGIVDVVSIIGFMAFIAVLIACLGMLGMSIYTSERRVKEVGIRKVLGAESMGIALLLSHSFLKILAVTLMIGGPISFFLNNFWLQHLPNHVDFGFGTILLSSLILLTLGLLTIGSQTLKVSRRNPLESLKYE